ncbi:MAG: hypothetical protein PUJ82_09900 [Spirochaetales bacterium]|nr:hypothetical protein [Spirochaetales bacterium]MDY5914384.1 hypothetical protein [Treponema sp.]
MGRFRDEIRKEAKEEVTIELCTKILERGKMTKEELTEMFKLTAKQLKAIKERVAVLA